MTANGELLTPKENYSGSYFIESGYDDDRLPLRAVNESADDYPRWESLEGNDQVLRFKNFCFKHYLLTDSSVMNSTLSVSEDLVMMLFCLKGECSFFNMEDNLLGSVNSSFHNILWLPAGQIRFTCSSVSLDIVTIYLEKDFLLRYIAGDQTLANTFQGKASSLVFTNNLHLRHKIQAVLNDMITCEFTGHLKNLYMQAKAIELLSLQLIQSGEEQNTVSTLKQENVDKMHQVKELIDRGTDERLSLAWLAREAGTNEQYLKKHFKLVFGQTVFGYILSVKMEKAKEMLLSGSYKIAYVAEAAGYKHPTHFTTAFKKYYGYPPQKIKGEL
jgi:AraC-like DNA-binding protein